MLTIIVFQYFFQGLLKFSQVAIVCDSQSRLSIHKHKFVSARIQWTVTDSILHFFTGLNPLCDWSAHWHTPARFDNSHCLRVCHDQIPCVLPFVKDFDISTNYLKVKNKMTKHTLIHYKHTTCIWILDVQISGAYVTLITLFSNVINVT